MPQVSPEELQAEAALFKQTMFTLPENYVAPSSLLATAAVATPASAASAPVSSASSSAVPSASAAAADPLATTHRVVRFSALELERMRQAAGSGPGCTVPWVSTFEALAAHLMRCVHRARYPAVLPAGSADAAAASALASSSSCSSAASGVTPSSPGVLTGPSMASVAIVVNFRGKQRPVLPAKVFANGVITMHAGLSAHIARDPSVGLAATASAVHETIASLDAAAIRRTQCWVASVADKGRIILAEEACDKLTLSTWAKFGLHEALTFDPASPPTRICFPHSDGINGLCYILDTPPEAHGALDLYVALLRDDMHRLMQDEQFRQFR